MIKLRPKGSRRLSLEARKHRRETPQIRNGFFNSFDGTRVFYSVEGQGEPLIFCYGLVCSSLHWTYQIEYFSQKYQAIWMDYRGHHNSETPKDLNSLNLDALSNDLKGLLDELKIPKATILGHSMGVNIVLDLYRKFPERVKAMVLANGTPRRPLETLFRSNAMQTGFAILGKLYAAKPEWVRKLWKLQRGNPLVSTLIGMGGFNLHLTPSEDIQLYVDQVADMDPIILLTLMKSYNNYDASHWLHQIKVPTLVLGGAEDKIIPREMQELMAQLIPSSEIEIIPHGSHCPQMDLPELVNLRIEKFLQKTG